MPLTVIDLEQWWLSSGTDSLKRLLGSQDIACQSRHCDFVKALQSKLRAFDGDHLLHGSIATAIETKSSDTARCFYANPRRSLILTMQHAFRDPAIGGMQFDLAMDGLVSLDAVECHRIYLFEETKRQSASGGLNESNARLLEELHNAAMLHYGQCHMGFRACVGASTRVPPSLLAH